MNDFYTLLAAIIERTRRLLPLGFQYVHASDLDMIEQMAILIAVRHDSPIKGLNAAMDACLNLRLLCR
jgi:hypothetical protein